MAATPHILVPLLRTLRNRLAEHKEFLYRSVRPVINPNVSVIRDHSQDRDHMIGKDGFYVVYTVLTKNGPERDSTTIKDTVNIDTGKNGLNFWQGKKCLKFLAKKE